ncbi:M23 family metallopeptidase [Chloroflexi bacterium TSY]|nr:M23 family metallopeptidase [Chloroflexi bacterium TSY]
MQTTTVVRARQTPGFRNKPGNDTIVDTPANTVVTIVAGPQAVDGLIWWQGRATVGGRGITGWMAESVPGLILLEKIDSGEPPAKFAVGDLVRTLDFTRIRRTPGIFDKPDTDILGEVWEDTVGLVVAGPETRDELIWWQIETVNQNRRAVTGWMAESAPSGAHLLVAAPNAERPVPIENKFAAGDLIQAATAVRVRKTPGFQNKPPDDVLGAYDVRATINVIGGPEEEDGLTWWNVGGITPTGEQVGWVAESVNNQDLLRVAPKLPNTNIGDKRQGIYLNPPTETPFGIAQLWGENPDFYRRFAPGGVPLRGHNGIDFLTPVGVRLVACEAGQVIFIGNDPQGFGNWLLLQHSWGRSIYAHLDSIAVQRNDSVRRGTFLGRSGNSGQSTGPHLHFAVAINPFNVGDGWGGFSDPLPYLPPAFVRLPRYVLPSVSAFASASAIEHDDATPASDSIRESGMQMSEQRLAPSAITVDALRNDD